MHNRRSYIIYSISDVPTFSRPGLRRESEEESVLGGGGGGLEWQQYSREITKEDREGRRIAKKKEEERRQNDKFLKNVPKVSWKKDNWSGKSLCVQI